MNQQNATFLAPKKNKFPENVLFAVLSLALLLPVTLFAQVPNIHYSTPQTYTVNTAISALSPTNTGGAVPANVYGKVTTFVPGGSGFSFVTHLTTDPQGNVYATANPPNTINGGIIYKITPAGAMTQFASSGSGLNGAGFITADAQGNIYTIGVNYMIQKITPAGVVTVLWSGADGYVDGPLASARFSTPEGLATDAQGDLYVADAGNQRIRKITPAGVVSTIAGSGTIGDTDGQGTAASFYSPFSITCDANGNIYVGDSINPVVRKITPAGLVSTYAGSGSFGLINGLAAKASFQTFTSLAADPSGNIYVSDTNNDVIRLVGTDGLVTTFAGNRSYTQTDGIGTSAGLGWPFYIASDGQGHLYFTDVIAGDDLSIRKIETTGYSISPALPAGLVFDATTGKISGTPTLISPATNYTITAYNTDGKSSATVTIKITNGNPSANANLAALTASSGTLSPVFSSSMVNYTESVSSGVTSVKITPTAADAGAVITVNGATVVSGAASGDIGLNSGPNIITTKVTAPDGATFNTYILTVTRVTPAPTVSYSGPKTFNAGTSITPIAPVSSNVNAPGYSDSPVTLGSGFSFPKGVAVDKNGNVYVAGNNDGAVKKIPAGGGAPVTLGTFDHPKGVAVDNTGNVYVAATGNTTIKKILAAGGSVVDVGSGFTAPCGVAVDAAGNVYVADSVLRTVQKIPVGGGAIITIGSVYASATGVAVDPAGNIYAADYLYNLIFRTPANGGRRQSLDLGFNLPFGVATDAGGNVYVADSNNNSIKMIPAGGNSTVSIGTGLNNPAGVAVDNVGNIYVADENNNAIKEIKRSGGYSISPFLPTGLNFDNATGIISGKATVASPATDYTVTAYNSFGSGSGIINIKVNLPPLPVVSYNSPNNYTVNKTIPLLAPTENGTATRGYGAQVILGSGFNYQAGMTIDALGNVYVADQSNNAVKKIPADGGSPVIIGSGFWYPNDVAVDAAGNVYVADLFNNQVKKIEAVGGATVVIGSGFNYPQGVAVDAAGNVYVADRNNNVVKKIPVNGRPITTLGSGLKNPLSVAVDALGNVFVAGGDSTIKKISVNGTVALIADTGLNYPTNIKLDVSGNLYIANSGNNEIREIIAGSKASIILVNGLSYPQGVAIDPAGTLYISDSNVSTVAKYTPIGGYFINKALPTGLSFNNNTGIISGTPTVISPATDYSVSAFNWGGSKAAIVNIKVSGNAYLAALAVSKGILSPVFDAGIVNYKDTVNINTTSINVTPTTDDTQASVTVNGVAVVSGNASAAIPLAVGSNSISIVVTSHDGSSTKTYTIQVTRQSNNAYLSNLGVSSGTLSPAFTLTNGNYTVSVSGATASIAVTPTLNNPYGSIQVNGTPLTSGTTSPPIPLAVGNTKINILVTAQDGLTHKTYTVTVTRPSNNAYLFSLTLSNGTLSPVFTMSTGSYTASVSNEITSVSVTPTLNNPHGSLTVNGTTVASGTASAAIALVVGTNTITTLVTAQDGVTHKTYTLKVTRAVPGLNNLYLPGNREQTPLVSSLNSKVEANNILSPNGDGINDIWVVKNIAFYPDNIVTVYDKAGQVVFTRKGYSNDWGGTYRGSVLSEGTYNYLIDLGNGTNIKGFITVVSNR